MPARMHLTARLAVAEIAKEGFVLDPVADFHHLVELDRLAREAAGLSNRWKMQRAFFPTVGMAGVTLRRLSIGARIFFNEEILPNLWPDDVGSHFASLAYVMAHSADPEKELWPFQGDPAAFSAAVNAWLKRLGATWDELQAAVRQLLAVDGDASAARDDEACEPDYGAICAALAENFGRDPAWWFWIAPESLAAEMLEKLDQRRDAEAAASARKGGQVQAPDPGARWVRAKVALTEYRRAIVVEKRKAAQAAQAPLVPQVPS